MFNLFTKFPVIYYDGNVAVNLLAKVKFSNAAKKAGAIFYPYTILEGERADVIAANYYDDPRYSWVIYMANDIVDPLYDWPLMEEELNNVIIKKYGSLVAAKEGILYWRTNWHEDDTMLTPAGYAALPSYAKKYFAPRIGASGSIAAYERSQDILAVDTNKIQEVTVSSTANFIEGEPVTQKTSGNITASAIVKHKAENILTIQHVVGAIANTAGSVGSLIGMNSGASATVSDVNTIVTSIPANEAVYWTYVSFYDYENELNESKRHIKLIDKGYIDQIEKELEELL
jgi:hypothetical protein